MKTKYFLFIVFSIVLLNGCEKAFLDTKQPGVFTVDEFFKTDAQAFQAILGCYDYIQNVWENVEYVPQQTYTMMSDEVYAGGSLRGDALRLEEVNEFRHSSNNSLMSDLFGQCYNGIYRSNTILEKVTPDSDIKNLVIAEAKVMRAFWYFHLVFNWGDVPLVTKVLSATEYAQPRTPANEVWSQIEKDLNEAIPLLPLKSAQSKKDKARWSKGAAQSLLGKVYLFQKKYSEAAAEFQKVIDSNEYNLITDFSRILRKDQELGTESVFEVMQPMTTYSATNVPPTINQVAGERSRWQRFMGPKGGGWFVGNATTLPIGNSGFGFWNAKLEDYQLFVDNNDPIRRAGTILSEAEVIAKGGKMRNATYATAALPKGTLAWSSDPCIRLKYTNWNDETQGPVVNNNIGTNYRVIRYADVLLMAAEAYNRQASPDDVKALQYINKVRARVTLPALTATGDALFSAIKLERRLELMFEGHRYHDLIRWGDAAIVLKDCGKQLPKGDGTYYLVPDAGFKDRNWLWPIPEVEMNVNPLMTQNPGF
jgi:tetratricopeptide (TPR) repeat protein